MDKMEAESAEPNKFSERKDTEEPAHASSFLMENQGLEDDGSVEDRNAWDTTQDDLQDLKKEKRRIVKNLLVVSFAFLFLFTAFQSLQNLQSSLNSDEGLGLASLCVIYATLIISCMFIPPLLINRLGSKWTIACAMVCYTIYTGANYYSVWLTLIPASAFVGLAAAPLWAAKCSYLTTTGIKYAQLTNQDPDAVITKFFGLFFMIFQSGQIWGNLISSLVLKPTDASMPNATLRNSALYCGARDCPGNEIPAAVNQTASDGVPKATIYTLMSIYLASGVIAILLISILLDRVKIIGSENKKGVCNLFIATLKHLKDVRMRLLIPLTIYSGLEQGFVFADFTKSFVTCSLGIEKVGYVMICFGVTDAIFSLTLGKLSQYTGRPVLMILGALVNMGLLLFLLFWKPTTSSMAAFFIGAAMWGFADAIWQTQVNAFYGCLFPTNQEAAFSNYRLWESLGFVVSFGYSKSLCVSVKLYILIAVLTIGIIGYIVIEYIEKKKGKAYDLNELPVQSSLVELKPQK